MTVTEDTRLRVNTDEIAAEVIDGEAVLINLSTGAYYTMDGVGAVIWSMIEHGYTAAAVSDGLASAYRIDRQQVATDVAVLVQELLAHGLVIADGDPPPSARRVDVQPNGSAYRRPVLTCYTDMAEVLALDPPLPALKEET